MPIKPENIVLYPDNWDEISFRIRFIRADGRCEVCGVINHSYINKFTRELCLRDEPDTIRVVLTVAHLDHDPTNNDEDHNLMAMCQRCHNRWDKFHRRQTRYLTSMKGQLSLFNVSN